MMSLSELIWMPTDNLYYAGRYFGAEVDLDPADDFEDLKDNNGNNDSFVTKINSDGSYGWSHVWGGNSIDTPTDLVVNPTGVFILNRYRNTVDFDDMQRELTNTRALH